MTNLLQSGMIISLPASLVIYHILLGRKKCILIYSLFHLIETFVKDIGKKSYVAFSHVDMSAKMSKCDFSNYFLQFLWGKTRFYKQGGLKYWFCKIVISKFLKKIREQFRSVNQLFSRMRHKQ